MARADEQGKPLFVNFGFLTTAQMRFRSILNLINDPALFEIVAELKDSIQSTTAMFIVTNQIPPLGAT